MPPKKVFSEADFPIRLLRVYLVDCQFSDVAGSTEPFPDGAVFSFGLGFERPSPLHLSIFLTISTQEREEVPVDVSITYAADFELHEEEVSEEERTERLIYIGYYLAPRLLYSYIRELFSNLTSRWLGGAVALPLLPIPMEVPENREEAIPAPPAGSAYQQELPLQEEEHAEAGNAG